MEYTISFARLVRNTCVKIGLEFLLAILLLYLFPILSISINISGLSKTNENISSIFFNAFSWMYICLAFIVIVSININKMLKIIKNEMEAVYHKSMLIEPQKTNAKLTLKEFAETNDRISEMQLKIKEMIENEKKQKEELIFKVSAASHDLKTPLTVIQGNSDLLLYSELKEEQRVCLNDILVASKKISDYFNALINYSKTFYDDRKEWKKYSILEVAEAIEQDATYILKDKSILNIYNDISEDRIVALNLNYVLRAVSNIVGNAIEYSKSKDKEIILRIFHEKETLNISIWNKGSHFSEKSLDKFGELFYRQNKARSSKVAHYGIGLAFVKRVAELHSGKLIICNVDDGAEVILKLRTMEANFVI